MSHLGKLEVRGDVDACAGAISRSAPDRALLVVDGDAGRARAPAPGCRVYDLTRGARRDRGRGRGAAAAAHRARPRRLPAVGSIARGVPARDRATRRRAFRLFVPQELGHYVVEVVRRRACGARAVKDVFRVRRMWRPRGELKQRYDVVIIGGGSHGLATAYYLAKNHGITQRRRARAVATSARARSGRNTTIIRSNYRTPEGAAFYQRSVELYERLSAELDFNLMFSQHGHLTLAHSDRSLRVMQERAEVNQLLGIDSRVVDPRRDRGALPRSSTSPTSRRGRSWARSTTRPAGSSATTPSSGASRAAPTARGVEIHQNTAGDRDRRRRRSRHGASRRTAGASRPTSSSARPPAGRRSSATSPACGCRSRRTSCRRS